MSHRQYLLIALVLRLNGPKFKHSIEGVITFVETVRKCNVRHSDPKPLDRYQVRKSNGIDTSYRRWRWWCCVVWRRSHSPSVCHITLLCIILSILLLLLRLPRLEFGGIHVVSICSPITTVRQTHYTGTASLPICSVRVRITSSGSGTH